MEVTRVEQLHIDGGQRLHGQVRISGAKNAVLKLMAASSFSRKRVYYSECPLNSGCFNHD